MRLTRIVCTIGPATSSPAMLEKLVRAGMNVARVNMSHGTHAAHEKVIRGVRDAATKAGVVVGVMLDLSGPKIRTGRMENGSIRLRTGAIVVVTPSAVLGTSSRFSINLPGIANDAIPGSLILMDDGKLCLKVIKRNGKDLVCRVKVGGPLSDNKGVNLPGASGSIKALTSKDRKDLAFGLKLHVDIVALSFVRRASDIKVVKAIIRRAGRNTPVIAKIEKPEAVKNMVEIIKASDGIMVARGDLGVEMETEAVPVVQKALIAAANLQHKPVITATQMLESMTTNPRPTRAEASDVANAILDGTDAVMLSGETAMGDYPVESVQVMSKICVRTETEGGEFYRKWKARGDHSTIPDTITFAARAASEDLGIKLIACFSLGGSTARHLSKYRPHVPIVAFSYQREMLGRMSLYRGTLPKYMPVLKNADDMFSNVGKYLLKEKLVSKGDTVVIISGTPVGKKGSTNLMKIHII